MEDITNYSIKLKSTKSMEHFELKKAKFCAFLGWLTKIVCNHSSMLSNKLHLQEFLKYNASYHMFYNNTIWVTKTVVLIH